jgi:hypothetical protein
MVHLQAENVMELLPLHGLERPAQKACRHAPMQQQGRVSVPSASKQDAVKARQP